MSFESMIKPASVGDTCPICRKKKATTQQNHSLESSGVIACCEDCAFWLSQYIVMINYGCDLEWHRQLDSKKNIRRLNEIMNSAQYDEYIQYRGRNDE